jgi:hypothetical protein
MTAALSKVVKSVARKPPAAGMGRKKGTPNKTTAALKDAILMAAAAVGEDGCGKGALTGYLTMVAKTDVKAFAGLLGRVLPMTVGADPDNPLSVIFQTTYEAPPK